MRYLSVFSWIESFSLLLTPTISADRNIPMGRTALEMMGQTFGRLTVIGRGPSRPQGGGQARWLCRCECGGESLICGNRLRAGSTKSCGCFRRDRAGNLFRSHGKSKTIEYCMFYDARKRAFKLGLPFGIEPKDIVIPKRCPVLGIPLRMDGPRDSRPSLDRIVPKKGYVLSNVRVISFRANRIKSDATPSEIRKVLDYVEGRCAS